MSYSIKVLKTFPAWKVACLKHKTSSWFGWNTTTYSDCVFVPNKNYPDLSKIKLQLTWTQAWYNNYNEFVPKWEHFLLDTLFIFALFWFFYWMIKFVFKVLFK